MMVTMCFSCCKLMGTMLIQKGNFWIDLLHYLSIGYGINFSGCFSADFFLLSIFTSNSCLYFPFVTFYIIVFSCWVSSVSGMVKRVHVLVNSNCWCFDFSILKAFFSFFSPFRWIELDFYAAVITRNAHQLLSCFRLAMKQPITM